MKITVISDTHFKLGSLLVSRLPESDLLIHSGDATFTGTIQEITKFNEDLGKIKHKYKNGIIFIPGNHDWLFETNIEEARKLMTHANILIDELIEIDDISIYGSPWQPFFCNWAFNLHRGREIKEKWDLIPKCDILVTHGPAYGYGDACPNGNVGCKDLLDKIKSIKPKYHIFGHIHEGYGIYNGEDGVNFINPSICNSNYKQVNEPITFEI